MTREPEELAAAIKQIRDYAQAYNGKKRKGFFEDLYTMLATPIPLDDSRDATVKKMYFAAVGALTAEIQPPTTETYLAVREKLNSALTGEKVGTISLAFYPDEGTGDGYGIVGEAQPGDGQRRQIVPLGDSLPKKRKLTKKHQELVDHFREQIPGTDRPFKQRRQDRG